MKTLSQQISEAKTKTLISFHSKQAKKVFMKTAILTGMVVDDDVSVTYDLPKSSEQMKAILDTFGHLVYNSSST